MRASAAANASAGGCPYKKDRVGIAKRCFDRLGRCEITSEQLDLARQLGAIRISRQGADMRTAVKKLGDHLTADCSGRTGDEDPFHDHIVPVQNRFARCTKIRIVGDG